MSKFLLFVVRFYQHTISYFLGGHCRFYPSCSHYAIQCLETHSTHKALMFIFKRLLKCHPFSGQKGFDPVPFTISHGDSL